MTPIHSTQLKISEVRCHTSQDIFPKQKSGGYIRIYTRNYTRNYTSSYTSSYIIIYTTFEVLRLKITSKGTLMQMGVTKPSLTSTKELQKQQRGSINKWNPSKHQGYPLNHELGSIIPTQDKLIKSWVICKCLGDH